MENFLNKKYRFDRTDENFDAYLSGIGERSQLRVTFQGRQYKIILGLNFINRKLAKSIPSSTQIVQLSENQYSLNTILPFKTHQQKFTLGEEIEQTTVDGRKVTNIFTLEGNKLTERQIEPKREVLIIREFVGSEMLGTSTVDGKIINKHWSSLIE